MPRLDQTQKSPDLQRTAGMQWQLRVSRASCIYWSVNGIGAIAILLGFAASRPEPTPASPRSNGPALQGRRYPEKLHQPQRAQPKIQLEGSAAGLPQPAAVRPVTPAPNVPESASLPWAMPPGSARLDSKALASDDSGSGTAAPDRSVSNQSNHKNNQEPVTHHSATPRPIANQSAAEPLTPDSPKPTDLETVVPVTPEETATELSLQDVIYLALENNVEIKNAYLDRIAEQAELKAAERKFAPRLTPQLTLERNIQQPELGSRSGDTRGTLGADLVLKMPTGGEVSFGWTGSAVERWGGLAGSRTGGEANLEQGYELRLEQPLLRGAGVRLGRLEIEQARLSDRANIQQLRNTLIAQVTQVIQAYRSVMQAQGAVENARLALQTAQDSLEVTQALVEAGRQAPVDIIQDQANVASLQVGLLEAVAALESQQLSLLQLLNLDEPRAIAAEPLATVEVPELNLEQLQAVALASRPDYLQAQLAIAQTQLDLVEAEDARRWAVNLEASLSDRTTQSQDARLGLSAQRTLGKAQDRARVERSRIAVQQAENTLEGQRQSLVLEVKDQVRAVNSAYRQLEAARRATALAERQLEIAREKQRLGREVLVNLIRFQDDVTRQRSGELNAAIAYLNALTLLDRVVGTTLETWGIALEEPDNEAL